MKSKFESTLSYIIFTLPQKQNTKSTQQIKHKTYRKDTICKDIFTSIMN